MVALWESNVPKVPSLQEGIFTLGEWQVTCRRTDKEGVAAQYDKVGPPSENTDLEEVRRTLKALDGSHIVDASWILPQHLPLSITGKWIRLKVTGTLPSKVVIDQLVYWTQPYLLPILCVSE